MNPSCKVIWSEEALKNVENIFDYLSDNWSYTESNKFIEKLRQRELLLSHQPKAFPQSEKAEGYRRSVLISHITIYYTFEDEIIQIKSVFDNRRDPNKLNLTEEETEKFIASKKIMFTGL